MSSNTVLDRNERESFSDAPRTGAPSLKEIAHMEKARRHKLKYCDSDRCIRGSEQANKANWHEWPCTECAFNPYNMVEAMEP